MKPHSLTLIVERIDARLAQLGMSRQGALVKAQVGKEAIYRLAQGIDPRLGTLEDIAMALDWSVGQLLGYQPADIGVSRGNLSGELNVDLLEMAIRITQRVIGLVPQAAGKAQDPHALAELQALAYGTLLDELGNGVPASLVEGVVFGEVRSWATESLPARAKLG